MKINISLDDALLAKIDEYASRNYTSRSGLISQALVQYFNTAECLKAVQDVSFALMKIADTGSCDEQTLEQLKDFERLTKLLVGR